MHAYRPSSRSERVPAERVPGNDAATPSPRVVLLAAFVGMVLAASPCVTAAQDVVYPAALDRGSRIASDFHDWMGVNGKKRDAIHQGIDIRGPSGQPVIAIADGRVVETHVEKCWGPTVVVDHGKDREGKPLIALYGHVGEILVTRGQAVSRGDLIARLGDNHRKFRCIFGVRHLHLQLGRHRRASKGTYWGSAYFLRDFREGLNPHLYWADGPYQVTCFDDEREYPLRTLTYPVPCGPAPTAPRAGTSIGSDGGR